MPLEIANTIAQLDDQWPNGSDSVDRGDDHIRLIKSVMKNTFPGPTGNGFSTPLTVDPALLNDLAKTLNDMKLAITNSQAIGNIIFRDDAVDPATLYPGTTWMLLTGDACVALATAQNVGQTSGDNNPVVPVPYHNHYGSTNYEGEHDHIGDRGYNFIQGFQPRTVAAGDAYKIYEPYLSSLHRNGLHQHRFNTATAGTINATIDVRGTRKYLCAWKRVK